MEAEEEEPAEAEAPSLDMSGAQVVVNWDQVADTFLQPAEGSGDPYFQIQSSHEVDGFYLDFEFYTVRGEAWTGQTGTFEISCSDPVADTGICVHFQAPGADGHAGDEFGATGMVTINELDAGGYNVDVSGLAFTDGTTFADFTVAG